MANPDDGCRDCTEWMEVFIEDNSTAYIADVGGRNNSFSVNGFGFLVITGDNESFISSSEPGDVVVIEGETSLNNNGDCIALYNETVMIDRFCYNDSKKDFSWTLCEGKWFENENPSPGRENNCTEYPNGYLEIPSVADWEISSKVVSAGDEINISIFIENEMLTQLSINISIISDVVPVFIACGNVLLWNSTTTQVNCSWTVPDNISEYDEIEFVLYPQIEINGTRKRGKGKAISLKDATDFGKPYISIKTPFDEVRFGDFAYIGLELYTGDVNLPLRIVDYIYKPRWVSRELDGKTIHSNLNSTDTALLLEDPERGENISLYIPLIIKDNCGGNYPEGMYTGRVRVYLEGTNRYVAQETFNITINGNNPSFCLDCPVCEKKSCDCPTYHKSDSVSKTIEKKNFSEDDDKQIVRLVSYEDSVPVGGLFKITVVVNNIFDKTMNFSIYSYVFNGSRCLSLGLVGNFWRRSWKANEKTIEIGAASSKNLTLENIVHDETNPGLYKFRVRLKYGNKTKDLTKFVNVTARLKSNSSVQKNHKNNITVISEKGTKVPITGMTTSSGGEEVASLFSLIYESITAWFASILKF